MSKQENKGMARLKYLVFTILLIAPFAPHFSLAVPKEPNIEFLTAWEPLPDRTMILRFGDHYYRHHILESSPRKDCNEISFPERKELKLLMLEGSHAWEYLVSLKPVFYSNNGKDWIFIDE